MQTRGGIITRIQERTAILITRANNPRLEITNLVAACAQHEDGLEQLCAAVRWYEGDSFAMRAVDAFLIRARTNGRTSAGQQADSYTDEVSSIEASCLVRITRTGETNTLHERRSATGPTERAESDAQRIARGTTEPRPTHPDGLSVQSALISAREPRPNGWPSMRDELYVPRSDDRVVKNLAEHPGETLIIKGPRQFGKTSLLMRYLTWCHSLGKRVALIDFSILSSRDLADYSTFLATVASALLRALNIPQQTPLQFDVQAQLTWFIEDKILKYITLPIVFAIDQADRILGQPFQEDFFSMLRMWHNLRAHPHNLPSPFPSTRNLSP